MIVDSTHRQLKMVVILTALALGFGTLAACVVPWFYCKPRNDDPDKKRKSVGIEKAGVPASQTRPIDDKSFTTFVMRINNARRFDGFRVVIPNESVMSSMSAGLTGSRESARENATLRINRRENSIIEEVENTDQMSQRSEEICRSVPNTDQMSQRSEEIGRSVRNTDQMSQGPVEIGRSVPNVDHLGSGESGNNNRLEKNEKSERSVPELRNLDNSHRESIKLESVLLTSMPEALNSDRWSQESTKSGTPLEIEKNASPIVTNLSTIGEYSTEAPCSASFSSENAIKTEESSSETINETPESEEPEKSADRSRTIGVVSSAFETSNPTDESTTESRQSIVASSTIMTSSLNSNDSNDWSTESSQSTSTPRKFVESSNRRKFVTFASIERPRAMDNLETIRESSICAGRSPEAEKSVRSIATKAEDDIIADPSMIPISAGNLKPKRRDHVKSSNLTISNDFSDASTWKNLKRKKMAGKSRYGTLSDSLKRMWRSMRVDRVTDKSHGKIGNLSISPSLPSGQSTMIEIESMMSNDRNSSKYYGDPRVRIDPAMSEDRQRERININEEPLDLSIHRINDDPRFSSRFDNGCTSGFRKDVFGDCTDFLRVRRATNEEVAARTDSIAYIRDPSIFVQDENHNIYQSSVDPKIDNRSMTAERSVEKRAQSKDNSASSTCSNDRGIMKRIKKILSSGKKAKNSKIVPVEYQRDSMETISRSVENRYSKDTERTFVLLDASTNLELRFNAPAEEKLFRPCTKL